MRYETVRPDDLPRTAQRAAGRGTPDDITLAVERGEHVFVPDDGEQRYRVGRSPKAYLPRRGYRVHERRGERNGVKGVFLWADPPNAS